MKKYKMITLFVFALFVSAGAALALDSLQQEGHPAAGDQANISGQSFSVLGGDNYFVQSIRFQSAATTFADNVYSAEYLKVVQNYGAAGETIIGVSEWNRGPYFPDTDRSENHITSMNVVYNFDGLELARGTTYTIVGSTTDSLTNLDAGQLRVRLDGTDVYPRGSTIENPGWDAEFQVNFTDMDWNQRLTVNNSGFDANAAAAGSLDTLANVTPDGWTWNGSGTRGMWRNAEPTIGYHSAGVFNGAQLSQTLNDQLDTNLQYLLSAYVYFGTTTANKSDDWAIGLYADGTLLGAIDQTYNDLVPTLNAEIEGSNVGPALLSAYIDPSVVGGVVSGDQLELRIHNNSGSIYVHPDEVSLNAIPEPHALSLFATVMGLLIMVRRRLAK